MRKPDKCPDKMKIAMLGTLPPLRGLSSYCLELALSIANLAEVEFISFKKLYPAFIYPGGGLGEDKTFPVISHSGLKVERRLTWYNPLTWLREGLCSRAKMLHAQWWSLPLFPVYAVICCCFKIRRRPVIITVHNVLPHENSIIYKILSGLLFKLCDHFIVHTEINKQQMISVYGIRPEKLSLIPHGTLDFHVKHGIERMDIRKEMGFDSDNKVILIFGAIRSYKGIETAIKAFAEVLKRAPESRLLIAGKLWENWEPYRKLINALNIGGFVSTYLDYIPSGEVYRFFTAADVVVLPYHRFDSQSGVGATAVSFRKPLIVTDVGGLPDLVTERRLVVPPGDPNSLAAVITECLKDPARLKAMAEASDIVARKLAWPAIAEETCSVYRKILSA